MERGVRVERNTPFLMSSPNAETGTSKPARLINVGDVVDIEIEEIGWLQNTVVN